MEGYNEYEKIERHLRYAKRLSLLNLVGLHFVREIERTKSYKKATCCKKKMLSNVYYLFHILETLVKPKVLHNNVYSSLLFYLDEWLFSEVRCLNHFMIEDDVYPLTSIYFNTPEWVGNHEEFRELMVCFTYGNSITQKEAGVMSMFLDIYEEFIGDLEKDVLMRLTTVLSKDSKLVHKLTRIMNLLKKRLVLMRLSLLKIISKSSLSSPPTLFTNIKEPTST